MAASPVQKKRSLSRKDRPCREAANSPQKEPAETTIAVTFLPHLAAFAVSYVTFPFLEIGPLVNTSIRSLSASFGGKPAMSGVLVDRRVILVAVALCSLGGAPAWANWISSAGPAPHTPNIEAWAADSRIATSDAAPARARVADSRTVAAADSATEGDEVPSPAFIRKSLGATSSRPADFSGGDEVPSVAAVNPAAGPETSAPTQQPAAARSGGDEVPTSTAPAAVPVAPDTSASKPAATEGSEAPANAVATPAAPPAPVDPIVEQLRELASGKFDRLVGDKEKRAALDAFYSKHSYAPIWITEGKVNDRALAAIDYLGRVDADGLNPADYVVPDVSSMTDPASLAEGELKLSAAVVAYVHHAQVGRVHWTRVSGDIFYDMKASAEIRRLAIECLRRLADAAPQVFADFEIYHARPTAAEVATCR